MDGGPALVRAAPTQEAIAAWSADGDLGVGAVEGDTVRSELIHVGRVRARNAIGSQLRTQIIDDDVKDVGDT